MPIREAHPMLKPMMRVGACLMLLAAVAVFLPQASMDAIHRALGLGPLPDAPIVSYLSRSVSALYAVHGGLLWVVSGDIAGSRRIIDYLGWSTAVLGLAFFGIDLASGLPAYWTYVEGPVVVAIGAALLTLNRRS